MTTDEITALRKEFEEAILSACVDFQTKTGVSVIGIQVDTVGHWTMAATSPRYQLCGVRVVLESL